MRLLNRPKRLRVRPSQEYIALRWELVDRATDLMRRKLRGAFRADTLVALVRGGLVLSAYLSHDLGIRRLKFFQSMKTASDNPHDYKKISLVQVPSIGRGERVIIVEDIIFEGATIMSAVAHVEKKGGKVMAVCALVVDEEFLGRDVLPDRIPIFAAYRCDHLKWIRFPWEQPVRGEVPAKV